MKLTPIAMIPTGITSVLQKSSEFHFKVELSKPVVVFICSLCFLFPSLKRELVEGSRIVEFSADDV